MTDIKQPAFASLHRDLGGGQDISRVDRSASLQRLDDLMHAFESGGASEAELGLWLAEAGVGAGASTVLNLGARRGAGLVHGTSEHLVASGGRWNYPVRQWH